MTPSPSASDMAGVVHRPDSFVAALLEGGDLQRVARAIVAVVDASAATHPMRGGSHRAPPEWHRRRAFAVEVFRQLQGDLKWTTDRALSALRPALAAHLDGRPWSPVERRTLWVPDGDLAEAGLLHVDDPARAPAGAPGGVTSLRDLHVDLG